MRFLPSADLPLQEYLESHGRRAAFEFGGQECPPSLVAGEDPVEGLVEVVVGAADLAFFEQALASEFVAVAGGGWRVADGGWRMADGGWRMASRAVLSTAVSM